MINTAGPTGKSTFFPFPPQSHISTDFFRIDFPRLMPKHCCVDESQLFRIFTRSRRGISKKKVREIVKTSGNLRFLPEFLIYFCLSTRFAYSATRPRIDGREFFFDSEWGEGVLWFYNDIYLFFHQNTSSDLYTAVPFTVKKKKMSPVGTLER